MNVTALITAFKHTGAPPPPPANVHVYDKLFQMVPALY